MKKKIATIFASSALVLAAGVFGAFVGMASAYIYNFVSFMPGASPLATAAILGSLFAIATCAAVVPIAGDEFKKEAK